MRRQPPDMKGTVKYVEYAVLDNVNGVALQSGIKGWYNTNSAKEIRNDQWWALLIMVKKFQLSMLPHSIPQVPCTRNITNFSTS